MVAAADAAAGAEGQILRAHFVQICVVAMHQNGRDTHIRQVICILVEISDNNCIVEGYSVREAEPFGH